MSSILETKPCPLGCGVSDEVVLTGRDLLHDLPGEYTVVKCNSCGLMRTNPRPTPEAIGTYYPDDYGPYLGTQIRQTKPMRYSGLKRLRSLVAKRAIDFNITRLPTIANGRMLELGCASGSYLHKMAGQGWQVQGIEFSEKAAQNAMQLGYPVHAGSLETAPRPDEPFDLIVGWMVLEHLHDPIGCLKKLREWAKPGAWLVLSVPNAGSLEFSIFKEKWYALQLPTHLHHFTPQTLKLALLAGGWTLEKIHHQRVLSNLIASAGYALRGRGYLNLGKKFIDFPEQAGRWNYLLYPIAWLFGLFGQTGRMTVWAKVTT